MQFVTRIHTCITIIYQFNDPGRVRHMLQQIKVKQKFFQNKVDIKQREQLYFQSLWLSDTKRHT